MSVVRYEPLAVDVRTAARRGRLHTPHGTVETPAFMPVGTAGSVKGLTPEQVRATGTQMILGNTYHLALRPTADVVAALGGLHRFSGWDGPILTDSGGYQVFSLGELVRVDNAGVSFRSHLDGADLRLEPREAMRIQGLLGADIAMVLDQCVRIGPADSGNGPPAATREDFREAVERSIRWAAECKRSRSREDQALFGIVQGGLYHDLRRECAERLIEIGFDGYAVGGLAVGESPQEMDDVLSQLLPALPADRPRYLMGVGRPIDLLRSVARGIDMFDCVMPTRNGRNSFAFTSQGVVRLRNGEHRRSTLPLDPDCSCYTCRHFSRGYLRHLFLAGEMLGPILASLHNVAYYQAWMARIRKSIEDGTLADWLAAENRAGAT